MILHAESNLLYHITYHFSFYSERERERERVTDIHLFIDTFDETVPNNPFSPKEQDGRGENCITHFYR